MDLRIFVVDDHELFRKGVSALISAEPDMKVCGEGDDCIVSSQNILRLKPDLVIVDISLKGADGFELIKNILASEPGIHVVVLSMYDESVYALRALRAGAKAYVMKQDAADKVIAAIKSVRKGQLFVSAAVASQMLNSFARDGTVSDESGVSLLSDRELEVLQLVGSGIPTRAIAVRLNISIKTVETHRAHLKEKLNLTTGPHLIQFAVRWADRTKGFIAPHNQDGALRSEPTLSTPCFPLQQENLSDRKTA